MARDMLRFRIIREEVNIFQVEDTPENREALAKGEYEHLIYDNNGYYKNLYDCYGNNERLEVDNG